MFIIAHRFRNLDNMVQFSHLCSLIFFLIYVNLRCFDGQIQI